MQFYPFYQRIHRLDASDAEGCTGVYGWEALLRGPTGTPLESPRAIFATARIQKRLPRVDLEAFFLSCQVFAANDPGGKLFVNLFPETIVSNEFNVILVMEFLKSIRLSPSRVVFEVLEYQSDPGRLYDKLQKFKKAGITFALDDFGTGHSDKGRLLDIKPSYIKCDQSMIQGIATDDLKQKAIRSLLAFCGNATSFIAEGLEDESDLRYLKENTSIRLVQGFALSVPSALPGSSLVSGLPCANVLGT